MKNIMHSTETFSKTFFQNWLSEKLAKELLIDVKQIDFSKSFMDYGLSSLAMVGIEGELEDLLNIEMDSTLLWDYPNIELIAEYLAQVKNPVVN